MTRAANRIISRQESCHYILLRLTVLDLLPVTWGLLKSLDDQGRCRGNNLNLDGEVDGKF